MPKVEPCKLDYPVLRQIAYLGQMKLTFGLTGWRHKKRQTKNYYKNKLVYQMNLELKQKQKKT